MRVQLGDRAGSPRNDHGAVAVIVAIMAIMIMGLAAFATDFGLAYSSKRNLQKGADAAALAAATEVIRQAGPTASCAQIVARWNNGADTLRSTVTAAADQYAQSNRPDAVRTAIDVRCGGSLTPTDASDDNKTVEVAYSNSGTTDRIFGSIYGSGAYTTERSAVADVFVPSSATGLRPYFLCLYDLGLLQSKANSSPGWVRIKYPSDAVAQCGDYAGNWYTSDCPLDSNNGTLDENTLKGCVTEVTIISASNPTSGVTSQDVVAACSNLANKVPAPCLKTNPGNVVAQKVVDAWTFLMTLPSIGVPVFDKTWKSWADAGSPDCHIGGVGNNGCYPIKAIAGVKVCGYKWNSKTGVDPQEAVVGNPCNGVAADLASLPKKDNNNYLWLKLVSVQLTGSSRPSGCALGDLSCDAGARGTRLVQ